MITRRPPGGTTQREAAVREGPGETSSGSTWTYHRGVTRATAHSPSRTSKGIRRLHTLFVHFTFNIAMAMKDKKYQGVNNHFGGSSISPRVN